MFKRDLGEDKIIYQKSPTFRISLPNNVAVGQKHCDADYNHPEGEINFWVPLTETFDSNGFYLESEPDKGDFHPFPRTLKPGDVLRFWGNKCKHYNEINNWCKSIWGIHLEEMTPAHEIWKIFQRKTAGDRQYACS